MGRNIFVLFLTVRFIGLVLAIRSSHFDFVSHQKYAIDYCVAQKSAPVDKMQRFLDYACGVIDCGAIQPGASCFEPDTVHAHASYALNQVYKKLGPCNPEIGITTTFDPSHGDCLFQPWNEMTRELLEFFN